MGLEEKLHGIPSWCVSTIQFFEMRKNLSACLNFYGDAVTAQDLLKCGNVD